MALKHGTGDWRKVTMMLEVGDHVTYGIHFEESAEQDLHADIFRLILRYSLHCSFINPLPDDKILD